MKVGIIFGGFSREREVSFAGGRTVYDNLNKSLFEAVPIFADSFGNFVLLDWQYIYKGSIRDFYPPTASVPRREPEFQVYAESLGKLSGTEQEELLRQIGTPVPAAKLKDYIDFAFLTLHGPFGEDGKIQGLLEWLEIPYSGSGIYSSAIGINKVIQKELMKLRGFTLPAFCSFSRKDWLEGDKRILYEQAKASCGFPLVVKPATQGSSIGVSVLKTDLFDVFCTAVDAALFMRCVTAAEWAGKKQGLVTELADFRQELGLPLRIGDQTIYHPADLYAELEAHFNTSESNIILTGTDQENEILIEAFISGREFSCIVLENEDGTALALPPTEIRKSQEIYSYRSKYLPGLSRKITPIELADEKIREICLTCEHLYKALGFNVYARIDGFINDEGQIFLNDPNTTSGMMPSSFFFHQAAEIGLNPSQFLTYIIYTSLKARIRQETRLAGVEELLTALTAAIARLKRADLKKERVAVLLGGYSSERHISVESGRNIYEKLASSAKYAPVPVFLSGSAGQYQMFKIPVNVLLKDNADDIRDKIHHFSLHPAVKEIISRAGAIISQFSTPDALSAPEEWTYDTLAANSDLVFIALHGRPGEDGEIQQELDKRQIPYNGSGVESSRLTIDKYATNELLEKAGMLVARHRLLTAAQWDKSPADTIADIEADYPYPFIAKPCDDGCSSAVKKIKSRAELTAFATLIFRPEVRLLPAEAQFLEIADDEEFPLKTVFLIEELITANGAARFMEITGGMLTGFDDHGQLFYEVFEPSEALSSGEVLSLEEKFLAGQGQNITPPRYSTDKKEQQLISAYVRTQLEKTARLLNIRGYCRIDAFVRIYNADEVEVIIIEANSLPGMTPATAIFHQAALNGYKPYEFMDKVLEFGQKNLSQVADA